MQAVNSPPFRSKAVTEKLFLDKTDKKLLLFSRVMKSIRIVMPGDLSSVNVNSENYRN